MGILGTLKKWALKTPFVTTTFSEYNNYYDSFIIIIKQHVFIIRTLASLSHHLMLPLIHKILSSPLHLSFSGTTTDYITCPRVYSYECMCA